MSIIIHSTTFCCDKLVLLPSKNIDARQMIAWATVISMQSHIRNCVLCAQECLKLLLFNLAISCTNICVMDGYQHQLSSLQTIFTTMEGRTSSAR